MLRNSIVVMAFAIVGAIANAQSIPVPNGSFEDPPLPKGTLGNPFVTNWNTPGPVLSEFPPGSGVFINTNAGNFPNDPDKDNNGVTDADWIDNADQKQAAFLAALSGNEFWQQLTATYQAGKKYTLTTAVAHNFGGGNPAFQPDPTAKVTLALYYLDAQNARHLVASRDVVNGADGLLATHFLDFSAVSPTLAANDPAVGLPIVVSIISSSPATNTGGFFDLDNIRVAVPEPASMGIVLLIGGATLARRRPRRD